jgi:hypothetical protein
MAPREPLPAGERGHIRGHLDAVWDRNMTTHEPIPLAERPRDRLIILAFVLFACTSVFVDRLAALDVDVCGEGSLGGSLCWYGRTLDPLFLANPQWLRVMSGISAFVFGPSYVVMAWAFWRGVDAVRGPALTWAVMILYSMVVHLWMEFFGEHPSPRPLVLIAVYLPYAVVPLLVAWRLREQRPFSRLI